MSKFITIIRPDFMQFCHDACKAATLNHLLFRIAGKSKDQPKEHIQSGNILWYAKTEQIVEEMSNAWGTCKVRKEVNALIKEGVIGRRSNPEWGADRTKHFSFGQEQCKVFVDLCTKFDICVVHIGLPPEVIHLIYSSNANDTSIKCICSIHQMEPIEVSDANDISIRAITKDRPTIDDYKEPNQEEDITISASAGNGMPALIHLEVEKKKRETDPHMPVIRVSSHSQGLSETSKEEEPTRAAKGHVHESTASTRAALPCIEHYLLAGDGESSQQEASATSEHITLQQPPDAGQVASAPAASTALGVSSPPPTSGVQQGAAGHTPPKPRLKKTVIVKDTAGPPPFPSESEAWGTTTCLHLFDFWRGAPLCDLGQLKYASSCAKRLAETYNRKQVVIVRTAMNNQKFWKEQGGADVCDVARHMQKELNKLKMPVAAPAQQPSPDQSRPTLEEVECIDPTWCVYQRPGDTQEWILWQGELLTEDEANDRGYGGGGGLYIQTQYA